MYLIINKIFIYSSKVILLPLVFYLTSCKKNYSPEFVLLKDQQLFRPSTESIYVSELLGNEFRIIPLETTQESIVGEINKIVKKEGNYYILSNDRWIHVFDTYGNYIGQINHLGNAPHEYSFIGDFEVYRLPDGSIEIWLADYSSIKIYDGTNFHFLREIPVGFVLNKFYRIDENTLICMAGQEDYSLIIIDNTGSIQQKYLKKEIPYLMWRCVQFIEYDTSVIFQLENSNAFAFYDKLTNKFGEGVFSIKDKFLTSRQLLDLFAKYREDYSYMQREYTYIKSFRQLKNRSCFDIYSANQRWLVSVDSYGNIVNGYFGEGSNIKNDLFDTSQVDFLATSGCGQSDDQSLIFIIDPEDLEQPADANKEEITIHMDNNPYIIEFY